MRRAILATFAAFLLLNAISVGGQSSYEEPSEIFSVGRVNAILSERDEDFAGINRTVQTVEIEILDGDEKGKIIEVENGIVDNRNDMRLHKGEKIVLEKILTMGGKTEFLLREKYRLPQLLWLAIVFVILALFFGRATGMTSIAGLFVSIGILLLFIIPRIVAGNDPLTVSLIGCVAIACTSLYLAHGFNRRTTISLLSTICTLGISAGIAIIFVNVAKLFGMGSEESMYLQSGLLGNVDLQGLLLAGIIIGCLGVLDDVTTAQTAAIDEICKANPKISRHDLMKAGKSVGKEHIASLINTLALAYVGASLPLLLLFETQESYPFWVTLNSEFLAEEIVRTLVGSTALLLAVPISTWFAAQFFHGNPPQTHSKGHTHLHI